ncbi:MAG: hypothetical protein PF488_01900 [Patescibacteria group bacterium]|jgi:glutaredoxin|nr:hypothetical protein [Patescibacteria group bacterium]
MKNKTMIPLILLIVVVIASFFLLTGNNEKENDLGDQMKDEVKDEVKDEQIILFYGDGCPHCEIVDEYVEENNVEEQVSFLHKEVYNNQNNAEELREKAEYCGLQTNSIGVPFLFTGSDCLIGDRNVIDFFSSKINK